MRFPFRASGRPSERANDRPGDDGAPEQHGDDTVCYCHVVTRAELQAAIASGITNIGDLIAETRAGSGCGTCRIDLLQLLDEHREHSGHATAKRDAAQQKGTPPPESQPNRSSP